MFLSAKEIHSTIKLLNLFPHNLTQCKEDRIGIGIGDKQEAVLSLCIQLE